MDACLGRFTVSPVQKQERNWCIYYEDEWALVQGSKLTTYFNPLSQSAGQISPIERERELTASVFARFAIGGALCNALSEAGMLPIYASKVLAQAEPERYPEGVEGLRRVVKEDGVPALFRGLDTTVVGYSLYGGFSFGCTELFERLLREFLGASTSAMYPVPILLAASSGASILAAAAYSPFEALRIRIISAGQDPGVVASLQEAFDSDEGGSQLFSATLPLTLIEIPYAAARFVVFDFAARVLTDALPPLDDTGTLAVSLVAGALAGAAASLLTHPLDTVVVRVCEGSPERDADADAEELCYLPDEPRGIAGFASSLMRIARNEGVGALYAGAATRALYIAALSAIQFFLYEGLKQLLHVARPDLLLYLDILSGLELASTGGSGLSP